MDTHTKRNLYINYTPDHLMQKVVRGVQSIQEITKIWNPKPCIRYQLSGLTSFPNFSYPSSTPPIRVLAMLS